MKQPPPIHNLVLGDSLSMPFRIVSLQKQAPYDASVPHRHNYYEIFFFVEGGGNHFIDFIEYPIESHSIHFVSPGQVHKVRRGSGSYGYVLLFTRDFYYLNMKSDDMLEAMPYLHNNSGKPILQLTGEKFSPFIELTGTMEAESGQPGAMQYEILRSYLNILLIRCKRLYEDAVDDIPVRDNVFDRFRQLLEKNFNTWHKPSEYSEELSVTEKHLNELCHRYTGKPVSQNIQERIVLEAKRMLLHSALSAKEIGYALNFDDPSYFAKFFRRLAGMTPSEFRTEIRKNYQ